MGGSVSAPSAAQTSRAPGAAFIFKKALISALVALVLFSLMIGVRTEAGSDGQLTYWTRFGDLAAIVAAVFGGSILIEGIFNMPGLGFAIFNGIAQHNGATVVGIGTLLILAFLILNLIVDVLYGVIDPRIRLE